MFGRGRVISAIVKRHVQSITHYCSKQKKGFMLVTGKIHQMQRSEPNRKGKKMRRKKNHSKRSVCSYNTAIALL